MEAKRIQNNNNKMANSSGLQDLYEIIIYNRFGDEMHSYTISNYEKAIGSLKDDLKLAEIGSRVDISQNGNVIYSETKKDEYANGGGIDSIEIEIKPQYYDEKDNRKNVALKYDVNYLITFDNKDFIELTGTLKPYHTGRDYEYEFEPSWFADDTESNYYEENREKIEQEILDKFYSMTFANGGGVPNNYEGKTPEEIWNSWTKEQKIHFIQDHDTRKVYNAEEEAEFDYDDIHDTTISDWLKEHTYRGQYTKGGGVDMKAADGFFLDNEFEMIVAKLKDYLSKYPYIWTKGNKRYVPIEGWQYAAALMGLSSRIVSVSEKENGKWQAEAQVVNRNGVVVCSGFSILNKEEHKWAKKDEDLANFVQTRAVSRALRNCLSYLIKAAGYSTTPSEEMYGLAIEEKKKKGMPSPIKPVKGVEDDFIFDRPEYNEGMGQPISPKEELPITKYVPREEIPQEDMLRKVWAESKANGIIIRSSEFMNEIELALTDETIGTESQIKSLLMESYNWFTENGIILRSKIFMKKFKDSL